MRRAPSSVFVPFCVLLMLAATARAQDATEDAGDAGPAAGDTETGEAGDDERSHGALDDTPRSPTVVVTALRHEADAFDVPYSTSTLDAEQLETGPDSRSLANAVSREPSVMVQKTGPGQSSPFIRGFTGFRTVLMIDGIRLNNSVWRDGPNQYFSTVDLFSIETLEVTRGPTSVLYGSDAIGGALNALTGAADAGDGSWSGRWFTRYATAERAWFNRLEFEGGEPGEWALRGGVTDKTFGNIDAGDGSGNLGGTGYDEQDFDLRLDVAADELIDLTFGVQHVRQHDVPRTHRTIDSIPFAGTESGSEIFRDLDQTRDLAYARASFETVGGAVDRGSFTLSWQRNQETQERLRTGDRFDVRGFDVRTIGAQLELESDTSIGRLTYGAEMYHDEVDSFRRDIVGGGPPSEAIQGNIADDAEYDLFGAFVQNEFHHGDTTTTVGVRYNHASAEADRVDNPNVSGSDPTTPGNVLTVDESWSSWVGSIRSITPVGPETNAWIGLSQGFRAPNLSDLTSDLEDSGIEQPTPELDPEHYLAFEAGARTEDERGFAEVVFHTTWIRDMIVRSPTGEVIDDTPVLQKDNVGDGSLWGLEGRIERTLDDDDEWTGFLSASLLEGRVDQFRLPGGEKIDAPLSRLMPATAVVGVTYDPVETPWWVQADVLMADRADRLSLRDEADDERIGPDGTPGYAVLGVRGGYQIDERRRVTVALENLLDKDYRIHGSGQNEPGRNLVVTFDVRF